MPDIPPQTFEELVSGIRRLTMSVDQLAKNTGSSSGRKPKDARQHQREQDEDRRYRDQQRKTKRRAEDHDKMDRKTADHIGKLHRGFSSLEQDVDKLGDSLVYGLRHVPKFGLGMAAAAEAVFSFGSHLTKNYRTVADAGQLFGGSMMNLATAAAQAGLPMGQYAEMIKKNSKLVAAFGVQGVGQLQKQVREIAAKQGMYGYSLDGIIEVSMTYGEIQRSFGVNVNKFSDMIAKQAVEVGKNATGLAAAFGTSREEILKNTAEAMHSMAGLYMMSEGEGSVQRANRISKATQTIEVIANIPGIGKDMVKAIDTAQRTGTSTNDQNWLKLTAGIPNLSAHIDALSANLGKSSKPLEDGLDMVLATHNDLKQNEESFKYDNSERGEYLRSLYTQLDSMIKAAGGEDAWRKKVKEQDDASKSMTAMTQIMNRLGSDLLILRGQFMKGIYGAFGVNANDITNNTEKFQQANKRLMDAYEGALKYLGDVLEKAGGTIGRGFAHMAPALQDLAVAFGKALSVIFTPENIETMARLIRLLTEAATVMLKITSGLAKAWTFFMEKLEWVGGMLGGTLGKQIAALAGVIGTIVLANRIKHGVGRMFGLSMKNMTVRAQNVTVFGGNGGGGYGDLGGGGGGGGGPGGKVGSPQERAARASAIRSSRAEAAQHMERAAALRKEGKFTEAWKAENAAQKASTAAKAMRLGKVGMGVGEVSHAGMLGARGLRIAGGLGRLGGMFVPGVGAAFDGLSAVNAARNGNRLAAGMYGAGAAVNGAGAALDATGVGALLGVPLDILGGVLSGGGMLAESFHGRRGARGAAGAEGNAARRGGGIPRFIRSPVGLGLLSGGAAMAAGGLGLGYLMMHHGDKKGSRPEKLELSAKTVFVKSEQLSVTPVSSPLPASLRPTGEIVDATRQQTTLLDKRLSDLTPDKIPDDPWAPEMVQILRTLREMQEANLLMQKELIDLAKKSNGYQEDSKIKTDRQNKPR